MTYTLINNLASYQAALKLCKGQYQTDIITGVESIAFHTLDRTKRKQNKESYKRSCNSLLQRLTAYNIPFTKQDTFLIL